MSKNALILRKKQFVKSVVNWGKNNLREFPWRTNTTPYKVFIAEVLLKRTTSTAAKRTYTEFLKRFPSIKKIHQSRRRDIEIKLRPVGLYNQRSKGLKESARYIVKKHAGKIPDEYQELMKVPHVGHYTAGAVLSFGFGKPAPILDSNVRRVVCRVFQDELGKSPTDKQILDFLSEVIPKKSHQVFNWGLLDIGAIICSYQFQKHDECPLKEICVYYRKS